MSKIDDLRVKYSKIKIPIFDKFVLADKTPTKKYLEYFLKVWELKVKTGLILTTKQLIEAVDKFDNLLPYIDNKDIYSSEYANYWGLLTAINSAVINKEENLFVRKDHVYVLTDNEKYLFVSPKTHKGSLKYGANTRWCTASKENEAVFNRYMRDGVLGYVIDKTGRRGKNFEKIALYSRNKEYLTGVITIYNANDTVQDEKSVKLAGWTDEELSDIVITFRIFGNKLEVIKKAKEDLDGVIKIFESFNAEEIKRNLDIIGDVSDDSFIEKLKVATKSFAESLKSFNIS